MQALAKDNAQARLTRSLGWFRIGLGLAEVAAPRTQSRAAAARTPASMPWEWRATRPSPGCTTA